MRRVALLAVAGALAFLGYVQIEPPAAAPPDFVATDTTALEGAGQTSSAWYCPWVEAGDVVDTDIVVVSQVNADVNLTLLDPVSNTEPTQFPFDIVGPGGTAVDVGVVTRRGESPSVVEMSNGPAAVAALERSDAFLSGDRCTVAVPKTWYLTGGSTKTGTFTELRLFNPFADNAEVTITAYSEFNLDLVADLEGLDVAGRSWTTIDMEPFLNLRDHLVFTVETSTGLVIPTLIRTDERGEATIPGSGPSETWEFPVVTAGDLEPFISVMSAGDDDITVVVDIVTEDGTIRDARSVVVGAATPSLIPLSDIAAPPYGVRLRASSAVAASVIAVIPVADDDEPGEGTPTSVAETTTTTTTLALTAEEFIRGLAGTTGSAVPSDEWIVPVDTQLDSETTVWVMNSGTADATLTVQPLADNESVPFEVVAGAEAITAIPVDVGVGVFGYFIESDGPVSVAWEIHGDRGVALVSGIAVR